MSLERKSSGSSHLSNHLDRNQTPSPSGLRQRPSVRSATFNIKETDGLNRRSSFFSEGFSETHKSFRASTDNLLLPRFDNASNLDDHLETSNWHSVPLFVALLPAVGGMFFKDGSAFVTDITLLGLAAIFLNWALRLPWEWYKAAQSTVNDTTQLSASYSYLGEEEDEDAVAQDGADELETGDESYVSQKPVTNESGGDREILAEQAELRLHELLALCACFAFPVLGAWLLHAIRSQLSRPSEGLVSNYNLTIFLLVAEIRPLSHMIKLVQRRTLFLQRRVNARFLQEQQTDVSRDVSDITRRITELEAHVANAAAAAPAVENTLASTSPDAIVSRAVSQANADVRKGFQTELDALNRAMRRYEKRMTITAIQVEARLQDIETRVRDVVSLAAAAQRSAEKRPRSYLSILTNSVSALIVVPAQYSYRIISLPGKIAHYVLNRLKGLSNPYPRTEAREGKGTQRSSVPQKRATQKKGKSTIA